MLESSKVSSQIYTVKTYFSPLAPRSPFSPVGPLPPLGP